MHSTIGHIFKGWDGKVYKVTAHDRSGYIVAEVGNPNNNRSISERAIGRTFHHQNYCSCIIGVEDVDGLNQEELDLLGVYDFFAYMAHIETSTKQEKVPPMWLCMNETARDQIRKDFATWYKERVPEAPQSQQEISKHLALCCTPEGFGKEITTWRRKELAFKQEREKGNPRAFFWE